MDGIWGPLSKKAMVMCLQKELNSAHGAHLAVVGIFGPASREAFPVIRSGTKGNIVKMVQHLLNINGAKLTVDGICGAKTMSAARNYQADQKLNIDGLVGPLTMERLLK